MASPLHLNPRSIGILPDALFTRLVNDLLRAEAGKRGVPQPLVDTTVNEKAPDGGVDAAISAHGALGGEWLPEEPSAWQYKAGGCPRVSELTSKELTKPEVVKAIERGEAYVFCTAATITHKKRTEIEEAIAQVYVACRQEPRGRVYTADHIAKWIEQYPGIAAQHFGVAVEGWQPLAQWAASDRLSNPFVCDRSRGELIAELRRGIEEGRRLIRVVGDDGVGKTRTVLETVRERGLSERVLYLDDGARLDTRTFWHFRQAAEHGSGILVIDECTSDLYARLEHRVGSLPAGFTVIAVGPRPPVGRASFPGAVAAGGTLELAPLGVEAMAELVASLAPGLSPAARQAVAERSGGSPKLLVLMAGEIARSREPLQQWDAVERSLRVEEFVVTELFHFSSTATESRVMRCISFFTRLGWDKKVDGEGRQVTAFFGLEWDEARLAAEELIRRGVVARRGRYLYVTPDVLANHLVRTTIDALGRDVFVSLVRQLTPTLLQALAERLRGLGGDPATILRDAIELGSLEDLGRPGTAELVRLLAPALPDEVLEGLSTVLTAASRDELDRFHAGRREVVWALEELAWWRDTFARAARLLRRLAWAENETYANNATGMWVRLFQVPLGGTEASFDERRVLLNESALDADPEIRRLGVLALGASLKLGGLHRIGGPPTDTARLPPGEWRPATYGEWWEIVRKSLRRLGDLLSDTDPRVRDAVLAVLNAAGSDLMIDPLMRDWCDVVGRLGNRPFGERKQLLELVNWRLRHPKGLSDEALGHLSALEKVLAGDSFSDRLQRVVGTWEFQRALRGSGKGDEVLVALAQEVLATPALLEAELAWLLSGHATSGYAFGRVLAEQDHNEEWFVCLVAAWRPQLADDRFIVGYLDGLMRRRGADWLETLLDAWAAEPDKAQLVAHVTCVLPTERAALRLAELLRAGVVPATFLSDLTYGFWARELRPATVRLLVEATRVDTSAPVVNARLEFLDQYLGEYRDRLPGLRDLVLWTIDALPVSQPLDSGLLHHWAELAKMVVEPEPLAVARACVTIACRRDFGAHETGAVLEVLKCAVDREGRAVWAEVLAPAIVDHPELLWSLDTPFHGRQLLSWFDSEDVLAWAEAAPTSEDRAKRLRLIASAAPVDGDALNPLARALIVRHGTEPGVLGALEATLGTGSWAGRESAYLKRKLARVERWIQDGDPAMRAWAEQVAGDLRKEIARARLQEEESGYYQDGDEEDEE